ncbi:unnamed protein product [Urochloa decumbens]|uniref:F-box domain-containing protein n=1 Tax=Urochloa decumbens TaxID=240449 RepID=A0ABC9FMX2_9POAL
MSPPPPPLRRPPSAPELVEELLGEILLRIPPEEPAHLVRAALVSKPWLRVVSDPAFRRGYRERHRKPPLLGFVHNLYDEGPIPRFVSTVASPCSSPALGCRTWWALDSRHGRVLIHRFGPSDLVVWDPTTGDQQHLPLPPYSHAYYTGAVLCAKAGCDHLDCSGGPFLVVFVGTEDEEGNTWASMYSSETGGWSAMAIADLSASTAVDLHSYIETKPSVLIGDALYFTLELGKAVLKYDLAEQSLTTVDAPETDGEMETGVFMAAEDGGLGFASIEGDDLHLWSWTGDGNTVGWKRCRVIQLQSLLPDRNPSLSHGVIGFAEGLDIIFLETPEAGVFTIDLKSEKSRKVGETGGYYAVLPYMSFCGPGQRVN